MLKMTENYFQNNQREIPHLFICNIIVYLKNDNKIKDIWRQNVTRYPFNILYSCFRTIRFP